MKWFTRKYPDIQSVSNIITALNKIRTRGDLSADNLECFQQFLNAVTTQKIFCVF